MARAHVTPCPTWASGAALSLRLHLNLPADRLWRSSLNPTVQRITTTICDALDCICLEPDVG